MDFEDAYAAMINHEGGYANVKGDPGGETYKGVTRRSFPDWPGWPLVEQAKTAGNGNARYINSQLEGNPMMNSLLTGFYKKEFWDPLDGITPKLRAKTFNAGVNVGLKTGIKLLQKALCAHPDGIIGPKTRAAAAMALDEREVLARYCALQTEYYLELIRRKPSLSKLKAGWLERAKWKP